jgi:hypothetical protein
MMLSFRTAVAVGPPPWLDFSLLSPSDYVGLALLGVVVGIPVVLFVYVLVAGFMGSGNWRDAGKLLPLLNLVVLMIAYAFYSADQPRTLVETLQDIVSAEFVELLPSAAATEAILLCLFWLLIATIMRLPQRLVLAPVESLLVSMVASGAVCVLFTVAWMDLLTATSVPDAVPTVAGMCLLWLVWGGIAVLDDGNPFILLGRSAARDTLRTLAGNQEDPPPLPLPPRPHVSIRTYLRRTATVMVSSLVVAAVITLLVVNAGGDSPPPSVEDVVRVELILFAVAFVGWCLTLRPNSETLPGVPAVMGGFTNLSLALSTVLVAATGVAASPVMLGPVPPLLVAVLPGLVTAVAVFLVDVRPHRQSAHAYGLCLAASLVAGVLGPVVRPAVSALADAAFTALSLT